MTTAEGRPQQAAAPLERAFFGHRVSSRISRLHASHSYGAVLCLIAATFLFASLAPDGTWSSSVLVVLEGLTLVTTLWTSGVARPVSPASLCLLAISLAAVCTQLLDGSRNTTAGVGFLSAVLAFAIAAVIGLGVLDQGEVNRQTVRGAICVYLIVGLLFVFLYSALANLGASPFFAQGTDGTRSVRVYFSFVTLATLGYGDFTPATSVGRTLAVLEALIGQLYLVTVVAVIVARLGSRREPRHGDRSGTLIPPG